MIVIADIFVITIILVIDKIFNFFIIFIILVITNIFIIIVILVFIIIFYISFLILISIYIAIVCQFRPQLLIKSSIKSIFRQRDILPKTLYLGITL